jgi:flagellar biosynthetic protein FliR
MSWIAQVIWPFLRISAMFSIAPLFGSRTIPMRMRVAAAMVITLALAPGLPAPPAVDLISAPGALAVGMELFIGLSMGFMLQLIFASLQIAGELVATTMGLSMAQMTDPINGAQVPVLGQLFFMVGMLLFLSMNGHLALISLLTQSFSGLPVGGAALSSADLWSMLAFGSQMFAGAVKVALPAVTALLAANLMLGVITRSAPQLNLFAFGLPITTALGLVLLLVALPNLQGAVTQSLASVLDLLGGIHGR